MLLGALKWDNWQIGSQRKESEILTSNKDILYYQLK